MEKLDYLIEYLLKDGKYDNEKIPEDIEKKKNLYRALVNVREPSPISSEFLETEDEYLQEEIQNKNIMNANDILTMKETYGDNQLENADKMCLWRGDITKLKIDCIINPANSQGLGCFLPNHNCIDNQIQTFAGVRMRLECNEYMKTIHYNLETSQCFITKGYNLPAKKVIHAVGPIMESFLTEKLKQDLANTYNNCLNCAIENGVRSISFPCISTGVFRFPKKEASEIAIKTVNKFLSKNKDKLDKVIFNLWSEEDVMIYERNIK